jgi:hypothetical protein
VTAPFGLYPQVQIEKNGGPGIYPYGAIPKALNGVNYKERNILIIKLIDDNYTIFSLAISKSLSIS